MPQHKSTKTALFICSQTVEFPTSIHLLHRQSTLFQGCLELLLSLINHYLAFLSVSSLSWSLPTRVFFFIKSDHKILSYGHFKIIAQECTW